MLKIKRILRVFFSCIVFCLSDFIVRGFYDTVWNLRNKINSGCKKGSFKHKFLSRVYFAYLKRYGSWIGLGAEFEGIPILPHEFYGIFISNNARIGKNVVIFHQVTIGSNSLKDSKRNGSPTIGDNCYIGSGAKIIGKVNIGENARIGANAVVVKDVPANSVTVIRGIETMVRETTFDNEYLPVNV